MSGCKIGTFFSLAQKSGPSVEEQAMDGNYTKPTLPLYDKFQMS
jgi:hypothetical protein